MSTIGEEISTLREVASSVFRDTPFTNEYLYNIWTRARSRVLNEKPNFHNWNYHQFYLPLKPMPYLEGCEEPACMRLMSDPVPRPIRARNHNQLMVYTRDNQLISERDPFELSSQRHDPIKANSIAWTLENNQVVIHNSRELKSVRVRTVTEDPVAWMEIGNCTEGFNCDDPMDLHAGISDRESDLTIRVAIEILSISLKLPSDAHQNHNDQER